MGDKNQVLYGLKIVFRDGSKTLLAGQSRLDQNRSERTIRLEPNERLVGYRSVTVHDRPLH